MTRTAPAPAGTLLREWRQRRRLSQLELADRAGTSTRHLSFVETGRATPSRTMVLKLAETLEVPLRDVNLVLLGAGHAPEYPDARAEPAARDDLLGMLDGVLAAHLPFPALVLDADFDVVASNTAVDQLLSLVADDLLGPPVNVVRATLHPRGLAPHIGNLGAWRAHLVRQVRRHAAAAPSPALDALLAEVTAYPYTGGAGSDGGTFALPLELRVGTAVLHLYSTVATFGTPLDVAASELAIETFLPADDLTRRWFAGGSAGS
jgi:transcriptional regulator with XRE-family HTH domain